ncbi:MAG TPA: hypothetical protein VNZ52_08745 [Candidatus Thermoplasmatota archaeon]|nr:hypothetical protein [Candidatus Thermoplasmatota archaeon]
MRQDALGRIITPETVALLVNGKLLAILLLLGVASPGCFDALASPGPLEARGYTLTVKVEPEDLAHDVNVTATFVVHAPFRYRDPGCGFELLQVWAVLPNGTEVPLYAYGVEPTVGACVVKDLVVEPRTFTVQAEWNGNLLPDRPEPHEGPRVAPGAYVIEARVATPEHTARAYATVRVTEPVTAP